MKNERSRRMSELDKNVATYLNGNVGTIDTVPKRVHHRRPKMTNQVSSKTIIVEPDGKLIRKNLKIAPFC
jgi:hypothetical protein